MAFLEEYPEGWQGKYMLTTDWWLPTASQNTKYSGLLEVPYTYCLPTLKFFTEYQYNLLVQVLYR